MLKITCMTCGYEREPLGIPAKDASFSWRVERDGAFTQKSYRIQVISDAGEMAWDSETILSDRQLYIECPICLKPFTRYRWTLTVTGEDGESASASAEFVTGIANRGDWTAAWLNAIKPYGTRARLARGCFSLNRLPEKAVLLIGCMGDKMNAARAYINGSIAMRNLCFPGASEAHVGRYRAFCADGLLRVGENVVSVDYVRGVSVILKMWFLDGSVRAFTTGADWTYIDDGPYTRLGYDFAEKHHGKFEEYDARRLPPSWREGGAFAPAISPCPLMRAPVILRYLPDDVIAYQTRGVARVMPMPDGRCRVDFGANSAGFPRFVFREPVGTAIAVEMCEGLTEDGGPLMTYGVAGMRAAPKLVYVSSGNAEVYMPAFFHTSMRYAFLSGLSHAPMAEDCEMLYLSSDIGSESAFHCDNDTLNLFMELTERTFRSNLVNIPTDCPGRERRGWTGDSYSVIRAQAQMLRVSAMYRRWFDDMKDNQRMDGWLHVEYPMNTALSVDMDWSVSAVIDLTYLYRYTGDIAILREYIECADRYMGLYEEILDRDTMTVAETAYSYGDWTSDPKMSKRFIGLAYYCHAADEMAYAYTCLRNEEKARRYAHLAEDLRAYLQKTEFHGDHYEQGSQSADIHVLAFHICRACERQAIFEHLTRDIVSRGQLTCGFMSTALLFPLLGEFGRDDLALALITEDRPETKSMMSWIKHIGATTIPEHAWHENASQNHSFQAGGMARWVYECLLGVSPAAPGYKEIRIAPWYDAPMNHIAGCVDTPYGCVRVAIEKHDGETEMRLTIPANTGARVALPDREVALGGGQYAFTWKEGGRA